MAASPSPSPDAEGVAIGSVLDGRYRIDAVLGSGGMGRVYRGEHTGIGRPVAIKILHADLTRNREASARFQREAIASGRLDHPNIVGVSDFGMLDDGACFLVMEALEGESLGERLERERRLRWREALGILRGVLRGLQHAHERGVVHRDIKPDNIFLATKDDELVVKILDFGIAKLAAGSGDDPASTRAGLTVGTPAYLSPEQAVGGAITPASDLYSATIVLFEMLTGDPPWDDKDPLAMLGAHVSRTPPTLASVAPELALPVGLEALVAEGLVKTAGERIASAADYIARIDALFADHPDLAESIAESLAQSRAVGSAPVVVPFADSAPVRAETPPGGYVQSLPPSGAGFSDPLAGGEQDGMVDTLEMAGPERARRAVSLAEAPPLPRRWLVIGAVTLAVVLVVILVVVLRGTGREQPPETPPAPGSARSGAARPVPPPRSPPPAPVVDDGALRLKALLYELEKGKDCAARRATIPQLVELGDPAAIPPLRRARYRMYGGILGFGQDNANACLTRDAEAAIKKLTPSGARPARSGKPTQ